MAGKYSFTRKSGNKKTGPIPVTTSPKETCPEVCPHKNTTCYAKWGPLGIHWNKLSDGERGISYSELLAEVKALPDETLWRHNQAGDLLKDPDYKEDTIDYCMFNELLMANKGKRGFTYTHYPMNKFNQEYIQEGNDRGFTINLSADSITQADEYVKLNIGPVVVTLPWDWDGGLYKTPDENFILTCPAVNSDSMSCETCQVCAYPMRKSIIGFPAHGTKKKEFE